MTLDLIDECMKKLSVKIFSPKKIFSKGFCVGEVVKIRNLRIYDACRAVTDRSNDIEVIFTPYESPSDVIAPFPKRLMEFFNQNREIFVKERKISEIEEGRYFDFNGELIDKQKERCNLILLRFVDYSRNKRVQGQDTTENYPKDMVLIVKAWGCFAMEAEKCEIGGWYRLRNLKADEVGYRLYASLSESSKGSISNIGRDTTLGKYFQTKKDKYMEGFALRQGGMKVPDGIARYRLTEIKDILLPGVYRIRVCIKRYMPSGGMEVFFCKTCGSEDRGVDGDCKCSIPEIKKIKVVKLLLWDGKQEIIAVCRNKLVEHIFIKENDGYLSRRMFDCMILNVRGVEGMVYHLIDLGFFEVEKEG